jgi:hypothetical protein
MKDLLYESVPRRSGPAFCPRVNATAGGSPEILVSSGLQKSVRVKVQLRANLFLWHLDKKLYQSRGQAFTQCRQFFAT